MCRCISLLHVMYELGTIILNFKSFERVNLCSTFYLKTYEIILYNVIRLSLHVFRYKCI